MKSVQRVGEEARVRILPPLVQWSEIPVAQSIVRDRNNEASAWVLWLPLAALDCPIFSSADLQVSFPLSNPVLLGHFVPEDSREKLI